MKRQVVSCGTVAVVAVALATVGSGAATAATKPASCTVAGVATITPGVSGTAANQVVKLTGTLTGCTGVAGITSGTFTGTAKGSNENCTSLFTTGSNVGGGTETITWNTKKTSTVTIAIKTASPIGNFTLSGKVTKGLLKGRSAIGALHQTGLTGNCISTPLTVIKFSGTTALK